jgi:hypothetical protein
MTESHRPTPVFRGFRRLRRWAKHTPNGDIALGLITIGGVMLVVAVVLAFIVF